MRKILASILVLAMALTSFSMVAFAAPATDVYFGVEGVTTVTATEDTYTVELYYNPTSHAAEYDGIYYIGAFSVNTAVSNGTLVNKPATIENLDNTSSTNYTILFNTAGDPAYLTGATKVADITVTRDGEAAESVITLSNAGSGDYDGEYTPTVSSLTIKWPSAGPIECPDDVVATEIEIDGTTYTNVPNKAVEVAGYAGQKSGKVVAEYWVDGCTALGTKEISFTNLVNLTGSGNATFNVAITGVKDGVVITDISVNFN